MSCSKNIMSFAWQTCQDRMLLSHLLGINWTAYDERFSHIYSLIAGPPSFCEASCYDNLGGTFQECVTQPQEGGAIIEIFISTIEHPTPGLTSQTTSHHVFIIVWNLYKNPLESYSSISHLKIFALILEKVFFLCFLSFFNTTKTKILHEIDRAFK